MNVETHKGKNGAAKPKGSSRKNAIGGFIVDKVDPKVMRKFIADNDLGKVEVKGTSEQIAVALVMHFKTEVPKERQVRCENCEGISDEEFDACPFCGEEGGVEEDEAAEANGKSTALVAPAMPAEQASKMMLTEKDLDQAVHDFFAMKAVGAENYWRMGAKLLEIHEKQLWKLRKEDGKLRYSSFESFLHAELKITPTHAYNAIDVAKEYKTPDEVRRLGHTKAALILKAAPEDREEIRQAAVDGETKAQLTERVKESREKHGSPKKSQQASAGKKGAASRAAKTKAPTEAPEPRSPKITVANIEGSRTIPLFKKPDSTRGLDFTKTIPHDAQGEPLKRAMKLGDLPFGRAELQPGVVQFFAVVQTEKGIAIKVETRRED